jgi:hypothetical protein
LPIGSAVFMRAEHDLIANFETFARAHEGGPAVGAETLVQGRLDGLNIFPARAGSKQASRNNAGIVEDQRVTGLQKLWKVKDLMIGQSLP